MYNSRGASKKYVKINVRRAAYIKFLEALRVYPYNLDDFLSIYISSFFLNHHNINLELLSYDNLETKVNLLVILSCVV